ncbi:hypothetical protein D9756_005135 [Leucocoprinus leucothites]|uniref:Uncharacterized protein n=1 Tax=Leucocoprinus leucothites TaxID=201217 RepID=A0A8H5G978_9AGAR|nr:hypothetical protein D9756_005135 [Leucoagaricus leucothites]
MVPTIHISAVPHIPGPWRELFQQMSAFHLVASKFSESNSLLVVYTTAIQLLLIVRLQALYQKDRRDSIPLAEILAALQAFVTIGISMTLAPAVSPYTSVSLGCLIRTDIIPGSFGKIDHATGDNG